MNRLRERSQGIMTLMAEEDGHKVAAEMIRSAREGRGLTVREAARRAEISEALWRQVEQGYRKLAGVTVPVNPRVDALRSIAQAVGLNVNDLLRTLGRPLIDDEPANPQQPAREDPVILEIKAMDLTPEAEQELLSLYETRKAEVLRLGKLLKSEQAASRNQ